MKTQCTQWSFNPPPHLLLLTPLHLQNRHKERAIRNRHLSMSQDKFHLYCPMCVHFISKLQPLFKLLKSNLLVKESITVPDNLVTCEMHACFSLLAGVLWKRPLFLPSPTQSDKYIHNDLGLVLFFFFCLHAFIFLLRVFICTRDTQKLSPQQSWRQKR